MGYSTGYIPGDDFGRLCDVCGRLRPGRTFRVVENIWICDRHPSYIPRQQLDRVPYLELGAPRSIPHAKPWNPIDTYEVAEAQVLNLVTACAPAESLDVTNGAGTPITTDITKWWAAAWGCIYLYDLITEAKRPARWTSLATTVLGILADTLYAGMTAGPGVVSGFTNADLEWGAYAQGGGLYFAADSAAAGLALVRAYQVLGTAKYLTGARACAWFLRSAQCGDKLVAGFSSSDTAGLVPKHWGFWTRRIVTGTWDHRYQVADLLGVEFLQAFLGVAGDETIGSPATTATFGSSRAAAVSTAIAEAVSFWTTPQFSIDDGGPIIGLSTATPREVFRSNPAAGSFTFVDGPLSIGTTVSSAGWSLALRALQAVGNALATTLFDWLMTFTSNPSFEQATTSHVYGQVTRISDNEYGKYAGIAGTYDPKMALSTLLQVRSAGLPVTLNGSSLYDLAAVGHLAPLYSARQVTRFTALKDALVVPRPRWRQGFEPRDGQYLYLGTLATCGLALQPYTDATLLHRTQSISRAAMLGRIYRYAPQAYTLRGH